MKTLVEAIKKYPGHFLSTFLKRAETTPSDYNRNQHRLLAEKVKEKDWNEVGKLISQPEYYSGLEGVVMCVRGRNLDNSFDLCDYDIIQELYREKKFV